MPTLLFGLIGAITGVIGTILTLRRYPLERNKSTADTEKVTAETNQVKLESLVKLADQLESAIVDKTEHRRRLAEQDLKLAELDTTVKALQAQVVELKTARDQDHEVIRAERIIRQRVEVELNAARETQVRYEMHMAALEEEIERLKQGETTE